MNDLSTKCLLQDTVTCNILFRLHVLKKKTEKKTNGYLGDFYHA